MAWAAQFSQQADVRAASLQALLLQTTGTNGVLAPGQADGERNLIQMQTPVHRAPLQQTRNRSLSLFLACSLFSLLMHYTLLKIKVDTNGSIKNL